VSPCWEDVDVGFIVSLRVLHQIFDRLKARGRRWWIVSDFEAVVETGQIVFGHGDQNCIDPLNTSMFTLPVLRGGTRTAMLDLLVIFCLSGCFSKTL
jgi:hypothetical protein